MKKILVVFIFLVFYISLKSDEKYYYHKLSKEKFVEWMQSVKIPGFELSNTQVQGSEQTYNLEYMADFGNANYELITPRIGHPNVFYGYEDLKAYEIVGPYDLDGFVAVFIYHKTITKPSNLTYLLVQMPNLDATFSITALTKERLTQEKMEEYFRNFRLKSIDNEETLDWTDDIPIAIRLPGDLLEISGVPVNDKLIKKEVTVRIIKTDDFLRGLRRFYKEKRGWLDVVNYKNITMVCKTTQDFNVLDKMKDGEIIEFTYYIK